MPFGNIIKFTTFQIISLENFEKIARATFPLKSEVDIKNLSDVVKKQLKLKLNNTDVNVDKLFHEVRNSR